jgi:hypothetical protein
MSCLFYRQEGTHTVSDFRECRSNKFGQLGWGRGFMGVTDFAFLHSHYKETFKFLCEQSEINHFFRFKARTKIPTFSLIFALSEFERRTLIIGRVAHSYGDGKRKRTFTPSH